MWKIVNASFLVLALQLATSVRADPALSLSYVVSGTQSSVDDVTVDATITNCGTEDLELYPEPRGLLSTVPTKAFTITNANGDQKAADFVGAVAKYSFSLATTTIPLKVGESTTVTHHLSRAYAFTDEGTYTIEPTYTKFFYKDPATSQPVEITATISGPPVVNAKIGGDLKSRFIEKRKRYYERVHLKRAGLVQPLRKRIEYNACTSAQEAEIQQSTYAASLYAADAEKFLTLNAQNTERYNTWFGEYDSANHETVLTHYTNIRTTDVKTYTYDCNCEESGDVFAYVYPDQFGHIYLCNQYMLAEITGTDSKAGTIIHESSHFTRNAGTKDLAYGQTRAMALAQSNSTAAVNNADSHEYFAENTPRQG
ncbi:zincin [Serendipita vermifera]|nr:zincin [Serendipita vermifera]